MRCAIITGPTLAAIRRQMAVPCDLYELRLDYFDTIDLSEIDLSRSILTLRPSPKRSEEERLHLLKQFDLLNPAYIDIEWTTDIELKSPLILSYHNEEETPDLPTLWQKLIKKKAALYKIATHANSSLDCFRLLNFLQEHPNCIGHCMGDTGAFSRILGPIFGNRITYASLEQPTAPGQIPLDELNETYRLSTLNKETKILGVIGYPLLRSMSPRAHNQKYKNLNAVYVRMPTREEELPQLLTACNFHGLSVTMPLKEKVIPFLDAIDEEAKAIGAVNTIVFKEGKSTGYNTDGKGALDAIEDHFPVKEKKMILLGAGGAARAIVYEAKRRGMEVMILNRTREKGEQLAQHFQVKAITQMEPYDILVNCTPSDEPIKEIQPETYVMDIRTHPKLTPFLEKAAKKKCHLIYGEEMFYHQANAQHALWFDGRA